MQKWGRQSDFLTCFGGAAKRLGQITKFGCQKRKNSAVTLKLEALVIERMPVILEEAGTLEEQQTL